MAATDKNYRDQYQLDIVFALTSLLMLVSLVWMFAQDYNREYKDEQRTFRDVEQAIAERQAFEQIPAEKEIRDAEKRLIDEKANRAGRKSEVKELRDELDKLRPDKEKSEAYYNDVNSRLASRVSFYYIELEKHPEGSELAKTYRKDIDELNAELAKAQAEKDRITGRMKDIQYRFDEIEKPLTEAMSALKKINDKFDIQVKLAISKQWRTGDWVRSLPVLEGFASPIKIHQFTINDIPIDYNFKYVTRFDRCMTCHQGIDRPAYTKQNLRALTKATPEQRSKRDEARKLLAERHKALKGLPDARTLPEPDQVRLTKISEDYLTDARINEFCAHPRLDLFVGANSKHPAEKFGCSSCHGGQGSSTSFTLASHTPNDVSLKERWQKDHDWFYNHEWEFPMYPPRFVESGCLKCHHQVTDLVGSDNRDEAPKLLRGYNLIKENGCFGCHEIHGKKSGKEIGPDLRLEPKPPLEDLTPGDRARAEADEENPPGTMRKVGPSLNRLSEKTNRDWTMKWLRAPRTFRPDTKMPHFYGLSNNHADILAKVAPGQEKFPDAEIHCITHFLFESSDNYLTQKDKKARLKALADKGDLKKAEVEEKDQLLEQLRVPPAPLVDQAPPGYKGNVAKGRLLFTERGCLACHSHHATETPQGKEGQENYAPSVHGEAQFGPNLSQLKEKLGTKKGDMESARKWLTQWILQPQFHSPRSRMPVTHLTAEEASDLAAWLLSQPATDLGEDWRTLTVAEPDEKTLADLARVYLTRLISKSEMDTLFNTRSLPNEVTRDLPDDERSFVASYTADNPRASDELKFYLGKKAVGRLGCFACHDIQGFDKAKAIGVGLNDWGKKDGSRLAFEDIVNYVAKHYHIVPKLTDKNGKPLAAVNEHGHKKQPYEQYFFEALEHHHRDGYLNQKILEPRSFDYDRLLAWDDRARMPQFKFARTKQREGESPEAFEARAQVEEAEAREAVATFILGLVAEQIPAVSINQPKGDRLAEVKGRQILEKYNCAGCHLLRGGVLDINMKDKDALKKLEQFHGIAKNAAVSGGDHDFPEHYYWTGKNPTSADRLPLSAIDGRLVEEDGEFALQIKLTQALRFQGDDKTPKDIPSENFLQLNPKSVLYPSLPTSKSRKLMKDDEAEAYAKSYREKLAAQFKAQGPWGGTLANLLVPYLVQKDKGKETPVYKRDQEDDPDSDSATARVALPPSLLAQGERTQSEWLYNFLLNPRQVRRMTILRMPRFNMSKEEARALVDYFAAVERIQNPRTGLNFPFETITQQENADEAVWLQKNAVYVSRLKSTKARDAAGAELPHTLYEQRIKELAPVWQQVLKDNQAQLDAAKAKVDSQNSALADLKTEEDKLKKQLDEEKDDAKQEKLKVALKELEKRRERAKDILTPWQAEMDALGQLVKASTPADQQKLWDERQAYLTDAFRLLANKELCMQCHQVGKLPVNPPTQGPPLNLAHQRLRPGWLERWIATPQRYVTYKTVMPTNFPRGGDKFQEFFAGSPAEQVRAARDALMAYPRAMALPVNQYWYMPLPTEKTGDKK